jgi:hypothetical protein
MTPIVVAMALVLLVAFAVISIFSEDEKDDLREHGPGHPPEDGETHLEDLLDP